jgi:thiamine biosynthesis lipoprotein
MVAIFAISMPAHSEWVGDARPLMGTEVSVRLWHDDVATGEEIVEQVFAEAERIDRLMSTYKDESRISEINRLAAQEPVVAGDELFNLIRRSLDISVLTLGAFDITYDSVGQHYDFRNQQRPDQATVDAEKKLIDFRFVELDQAAGTVSFKQDGVRINLGGIAKGYVVERGVSILRSRGVQNGIVTAGGKVIRAITTSFSQAPGSRPAACIARRFSVRMPLSRTLCRHRCSSWALIRACD